MILRPYQIEIINETRARMREGHRSVLIQSPTGSGKTALMAQMFHGAAKKGVRSIFIVHRRELINQSIAAFNLEGIEHGIIANGYPESPDCLIQIASIQTLIRRHQRHATPRFVCFDEAHHIAAKSWSKMAETYPEAHRIGLTATPERLDGKGLEDWFEQMVQGPTVQELIRDGYLAEYRLFVPPGQVDTTGVRRRAGDFAKDQLSKAADRPTITGSVLEHYKSLARGKRAVIFCVSVEHSQHVADEFNAAGIPAEHVDGETDKEERDAAVRRFDQGDTLVLCNVDLFGEGFDLPALEASILVRPTESLGMYLQQVGRALRPSPGKECALIIDHAGNCERHGLPDSDHAWSLKGREKRQGTGAAKEAPVRICPRCFGAQAPGRLSCMFCGYVFEVKPRQVAHVEGNLVELDIEAARREKRQEQGRAQTYDQLVALGIKRGYKHPRRWAHFVFQHRQRQRMAGGKA